MNADGSERMTIVTGCHLPDGIVVDVEAGHIYWPNMGIPSLDDGSIERADIDGKNRKTIVPQGHTHAIDNKPAESEIVVTHLMEGIGIALDVPNDRMFVTDFAGSVYSARLDGSGERNFLFAQGNLTGIAYG